jgi:hypothetical protein
VSATPCLAGISAQLLSGQLQPLFIPARYCCGFALARMLA